MFSGPEGFQQSSLGDLAGVKQTRGHSATRRNKAGEDLTSTVANILDMAVEGNCGGQDETWKRKKTLRELFRWG